jgi:hypothetical protein
MQTLSIFWTIIENLAYELFPPIPLNSKQQQLELSFYNVIAKKMKGSIGFLNTIVSWVTKHKHQYLYMHIILWVTS